MDNGTLVHKFVDGEITTHSLVNRIQKLKHELNDLFSENKRIFKQYGP